MDDKDQGKDLFRDSDRPGSTGSGTDKGDHQGQQSSGGGQNQDKDTSTGGRNERKD